MNTTTPAHEQGIDGAEIARLRQDSRDLARQDGRAEARNADRELAWHELIGRGTDPAPEVPSGAEGLVTWDTSPDQAGHLTLETTTDDEADVCADMAREGRREAEQDLRRAASADNR